MKAPAVKTIGIAFNLKKPSDDDTYAEYDDIETIQAVEAEIKRYGFKVVRLEQNDSLLRNIRRAKVDFVVNIAEGKGSTRARESQVPCLLESLGIPYYVVN
ncbi:MAG: D-alanine--D-alanine ligase, partial [Pseudomonadota bacterium]